MAKKEKIEPSDDSVRDTILKCLYDSWKNPRGMKSFKLKISDVYSNLKKQGIGRKYVIRNMLYLIETGWVIEEIKESQFQKGSMKYVNESRTYRISKDGIDLFEGDSKFQKSNNLTGINMSNIQNSIIVLGNHNYVRQEYGEIAKTLTEFGSRIRMSSELSDDEKADYQSEIETIKSQLGKSNPSKSIIQKSWDALKDVATLSSVAEFYLKTQPLIVALLGKVVGN